MSRLALVDGSSLLLLTDGSRHVLLTRQYAFPDADDAVGSWTTAPLFSKVDEHVADDSTFISSETLIAPGTTSVAKLSLDSLLATSVATTHTLQVRAKVTFTLGTTHTFTAELRQGSTLIATLTQSPLTTSYVTYSYTLTTTEAGSITDYTALAVWLSSTFSVGNLGGVQVSWVEFETPMVAGGILAPNRQRRQQAQIVR